MGFDRPASWQEKGVQRSRLTALAQTLQQLLCLRAFSKGPTGQDFLDPAGEIRKKGDESGGRAAPGDQGDQVPRPEELPAQSRSPSPGRWQDRRSQLCQGFRSAQRR